ERFQAKKLREVMHERPELRGRRGLFAQQGELVQDNRVARNEDRAGHQRVPHISSSAKGWIGRFSFGLGFARKMVPAGVGVVGEGIWMLSDDPSASRTSRPAASTSWASSVMALPSLSRAA